MIKYFHFVMFISLYIFNSVSFAQNLKEDWQKEDLICKVSSLQISKFYQKEKFGEPVDILTDSTSIDFNNNGNYLKKFEYRIKENWYLNYETYEYYDGSNCLKKISKGRGSKLSDFTNYECSNDLIQSSVYFVDKVAKQKNQYQYDKNFNNTKIEIYNIGFNNDETISTIWLFKYNTNKKIAESKKYNGDGKLTNVVEYKYDLKGNLISRDNYVPHSYKKEMQLIDYVTYTYDSKNNVLSETTKGNIGQPGGSKPSITMLYEYIYNSNNTIKQIKKQMLNTKYIEYIIKYISYDSRGNWLEKIVTNSIVNDFKVKRLINY